MRATAHILVERGYARLTTNAIAARAGVSIGSLYQYFPSKEAVVGALVDEHIAGMVAELSGELTRSLELSFADGARRMVAAMIRIHSRNTELHRALIEQVPRIGRMKRIREIDQQFILLVRGVMESRRDQIRPSDLDLVAFIVTHAAKAVTFAVLSDRPELLQDPRFEDELVDLIVRYAGNPTDG